MTSEEQVSSRSFVAAVLDGGGLPTVAYGPFPTRREADAFGLGLPMRTVVLYVIGTEWPVACLTNMGAGIPTVEREATPHDDL